MPDRPRQLPFLFPHTPHFTAAEFLPTAANQLALGFLANTTEWPQGRLALWGGPGTGKTHLLHVWAAEHGAALLKAASLNGAAWPGGACAIDDLDHIPDEPALLHVLNAAAEAGRPVLLAASRAPARLPIRLPDLASRLRATSAAEIGPADDPFLAALLARLVARRQMVLGPAVQAWLLARLPRTPGAIRDAVARLDRAALAAGSAVTRNLAAHALADLLHDDFAGEAAEASQHRAGIG